MTTASVFDVAAYLLGKFDGPISTMKLQKLCFYSQAWALVWDESPIFPEPFQAWANGPVCPELYQAHRGSYSIEELPSTVDADPSRLTGAFKETIDLVVDAYGDMSGGALSALTHSERPWLDARGDLGINARSSVVIQHEDIADYYARRLRDGA